MIKWVSQIDKVLKVDYREEYFENPICDYFNPQKENIKCIISKKNWSFIRHVPDNYWPSSTFGYAILRWMNCQARCHYCYLQSYFKSWDMVRFENINEYISFLEKFIETFIDVHSNKDKIILYDGDFYDSFWYFDLKNSIAQINKLIQLIENYENVYLDIRTKCLVDNFKQYDELLISNKVAYWITFSPQSVIDKYEWGSSDLSLRLKFAKYLVDRWANIGVRMDPIIIDNDYNEAYEEYSYLINTIQNNIGEDNIVDWSMWFLRIKSSLYKKLRKSKSILINNLIENKWFWSYEDNIKSSIISDLKNIIKWKVYLCMSD